MSTDFLTHYRVPIPPARRYGVQQRLYLLLGYFTRVSFSTRNPLYPIFKVLISNSLGFRFSILPILPEKYKAVLKAPRPRAAESVETPRRRKAQGNARQDRRKGMLGKTGRGFRPRRFWWSSSWSFRNNLV